MDQKPLRILLLEDDPADAHLLQEGLRDAVQNLVNWVWVQSVKEALEQLQIDTFDIILLDLDLPDSQGMETFLKVQAAAGQIPIMLLTGMAEQTLAAQAVRAGAQDYLIKGYRINPLERAIYYAIEHHRLQTLLDSLSLTDDLTGLHNRRSFLLLAEEQFKLARRNRQELSVFLCDIDGMKQINDTFGPAEGDKALMGLAEILRTTFRDSDIIARLGEDQFAALAIGAIPASAELLTARLQVTLNRHNARPDRLYQLSFSVGVAQLESDVTMTVEELISNAEQALLEHKQNRRKARGA